MATTTPNFGWAVPTSTDLVKDGAVAIETLGDSIDASLVDLKGGTTNQVLAKNSNTDMDFKWVSDATGMTNPMTTTGDTIYSSSGSTPARLGIGSTGQVLTVAGGLPSWATPAGSASGLTYITGTSFSAVSSFSLPNNTFTSTYTNYLISLSIISCSANNDFGVRGRTSGTDLTTNVYDYAVDGSKTNSAAYAFGGASADRMYHGAMSTATPLRYTMNVFSPQTTDNTYIRVSGIGTESNIAATVASMGIARSANQFDSFTFLPSTGTVTGFYRVYGIANS
jgi:hypothetical protein